MKQLVVYLYYINGDTDVIHILMYDVMEGSGADVEEV